MQTNLQFFSDRLIVLFKSLGFENPNEFAKALGYERSEKIQRLLRDRQANPSFEIIQDIANKFADVNLRWLITGEGNILNEKIYREVFSESENNTDSTKKNKEPDRIMALRSLFEELLGEAVNKPNSNRTSIDAKEIAKLVDDRIERTQSDLRKDVSKLAEMLKHIQEQLDKERA